MLINDTQIEKILKLLLQKNLSLSIKNKQLKKGRLVLFKQNNYHIELTVSNNGALKKFEIPIPYNIESWEDDNLIYFDYRLITLAQNNKDIHNLITGVQKNCNNKFYDSILEISIAS